MAKSIKKKTVVTCEYCDCDACMAKASKEEAAIKRAESEFLHTMAKLGITAEKAKSSIFALWQQVDLDAIEYCESVKLSVVLAAKS